MTEKTNPLLDAPLRKTGADIPEGSYPGVLLEFGEPALVPVAEQFRKPGKPDQVLRMDVVFAIRIKGGGVERISGLVSVPEGGALNQRSNLYKYLKALRGGDEKFFKKDGEIADGVSLRSFIGSPATVQVKRNKKDFPTLEAVAGPMDGMNYPTAEECKGLTIEPSDDIPF